MEAALHAAQERYPVTPKGEDDSWWLPARLGGSAPTPAEAEVIAEQRAQERAERKAREEEAEVAGGTSHRRWRRKAPDSTT